ncbi:MAG TPA: hypothetical protein PLX96_07360, partial [Candidatus Omnitrophota bacterium]|nr:hypothetical protein [Candidatus Omnitrophota bacterium]
MGKIDQGPLFAPKGVAQEVTTWSGNKVTSHYFLAEDALGNQFFKFEKLRADGSSFDVPEWEYSITLKTPPAKELKGVEKVYFNNETNPTRAMTISYVKDGAGNVAETVLSIYEVSGGADRQQIGKLLRTETFDGQVDFSAYDMVRDFTITLQQGWNVVSFGFDPGMTVGEFKALTGITYAYFVDENTGSFRLMPDDDVLLKPNGVYRFYNPSGSKSFDFENQFLSFESVALRIGWNYFGISIGGAVSDLLNLGEGAVVFNMLNQMITNLEAGVPFQVFLNEIPDSSFFKYPMARSSKHYYPGESAASPEAQASQAGATGLSLPADWDLTGLLGQKPTDRYGWESTVTISGLTEGFALSPNLKITLTHAKDGLEESYQYGSFSDYLAGRNALTHQTVETLGVHANGYDVIRTDRHTDSGWTETTFEMQKEREDGVLLRITGLDATLDLTREGVSFTAVRVLETSDITAAWKAMGIREGDVETVSFSDFDAMEAWDAVDAKTHEISHSLGNLVFKDGNLYEHVMTFDLVKNETSYSAERTRGNVRYVISGLSSNFAVIEDTVYLATESLSGNRSKITQYTEDFNSDPVAVRFYLGDVLDTSYNYENGVINSTTIYFYLDKKNLQVRASAADRQSDTVSGRLIFDSELGETLMETLQWDSNPVEAPRSSRITMVPGSEKMRLIENFDATGALTSAIAAGNLNMSLTNGVLTYTVLSNNPRNSLVYAGDDLVDATFYSFSDTDSNEILDEISVTSMTWIDRDTESVTSSDLELYSMPSELTTFHVGETGLAPKFDDNGNLLTGIVRSVSYTDNAITAEAIQ